MLLKGFDMSNSEMFKNTENTKEALKHTIIEQ